MYLTRNISTKEFWLCCFDTNMTARYSMKSLKTLLTSDLEFRKDLADSYSIRDSILYYDNITPVDIVVTKLPIDYTYDELSTNYPELLL